MLNLFLIEFLKYRRLAVAVCCAQILILFVLLGLGVDLARTPGFPVWLLANAGIAGLFGCLQMLTHKRPMHWVWLLQRPVAPRRIVAALLLAGLLLLAIACLLPHALVLGVRHLQGTAGVEARHYLLLPLAAGLFAASYLLACFAALSPHRLGLLALLPCLAFLPNQPDSRLALAGVLLVLYGALLAILCFKPDPTQTSTRPGILLATELPVQLGLYWVLALLFALGSAVLQLLNLAPHPVAEAQPGTPYALLQMGDAGAMRYALEGTQHPDRDFLLQQIEIAEVFNLVGPGPSHFPRRHQRPPLDGLQVLKEPESPVEWRFRHGSMLFEGFDAQQERLVGFLGPAGFSNAEAVPVERFSSVPRLVANTWVISDTTLYQIDWRGRALHERFVLPGSTDGERLSAALTQTPRVSALFSDRHLYLFRAPAFNDPAEALEPSGIVPLTPPIQGEGRRYALLELIDGYLVSSLSLPENQPESDFGMFEQRDLLLYRTGEDRVAELLSAQRLQSNFGDGHVYRGLVLAPGMRLLSDVLVGLYARKNLGSVLPLATVPPRVWLAAALVSLLSAGMTLHLLRGVPLPPRTCRFWIVLNSCTGLVGLLSFVLGYYWKRLSLRRTIAARPALHSATA